MLLILHPEGLPRADNVSIDARVAAFAVAGAVLAVGLASLLPAWHISRLDVSHSLEGGSRGLIARARRHRVQRVLVAGQVALASILLAGMVLMLESFLHLRALPRGFAPGNVLTVRGSPRRHGAKCASCGTVLRTAALASARAAWNHRRGWRGRPPVVRRSIPHRSWVRRR